MFAGLADNRILKFDTQLSPTAPVSDSLRLGVPKTTLRGTAGFTAGSVSVAVFVNYRDGVTNTFATPTGVGVYDAYTTADLRVIWTLPNTGWAEGTELGLQVNDLFEGDPPSFLAADGIGGTYNPIGRYLAVSLRKTF